jgi:hypothetical protein
MKGEERLWTILNDKLDTLRATNQLPEAIRVAETALEIAKRAFKGNEVPLATSFEKLGSYSNKRRLHCRRGKPAEGACNPGKGETTRSACHLPLGAAAGILMR